MAFRKIEPGSGRQLSVPSAIVTGGTGGLGSAVVGRLLDDGWRVIVPWVAEHELDRLEAHERLELVGPTSPTPTPSARSSSWPRAMRAGRCAGS